jgi:hypothetical protein
MEYKNRVEISHKLYNKLEPLAKLDRVIFVADVDKFKNMELLNLYWKDHNRMDDVVQMEIDIGGGHINITVSNHTLVCDIQNSNHPKTSSDHSGHGIGLQQVERRLELAYPGRYTWKQGTKENNKIYYSTITIQL